MPPPIILPVYFAPYEDVERAVKQAMTQYPQKIDNPDAGIYETDWIKGDARFNPPHQAPSYPDGFRYRLLVRIVKGKSEAKPAIKVIISKTGELQRDFFAAPEPIPSDGLEEMVVLYRIQRELALEKAIRRSQERSSSGDRDDDEE
jgi:hypothetical protein